MIDATCPLVTKVHLRGKKYLAQGRVIILVGHAGHAEVEGSRSRPNSRAGASGSETEEDVEALPLALDTPVAYVTQTTLSIDDTRGVIEAIKSKINDVVGPETNDICYATQKKIVKTAVRELTKIADVVLVISGRKTARTPTAYLR